MTSFISPAFPRRLPRRELTEKDKSIGFRGIPTTIEELKQARTVRNDELKETMQSEAFEVGFIDPTITNKRLSIF